MAPDEQSAVLVYLNDEDGVAQPENFQMCPLGVQLYSPRPMSDCELLDFRLNVPDDNGASADVACTGLVVQCARDERRNNYRIWVKFLDLDAESKTRLHKTCHKNGHICPFCQNF